MKASPALVGKIKVIAFLIFMTLELWFLAIVLGTTSQVSQIFLTRAYHLEKMSDVTIINYFGIVLAVIVGLTLFNVSYTLLNYIGMIAIILSLYFNTLFSLKRNTVLFFFYNALYFFLQKHFLI